MNLENVTNMTKPPHVVIGRELVGIKKKTGRGTFKHSQESVDRCVSLSREFGAKEAARVTGISINTIYNFLKPLRVKGKL